MPDTFAKDSGLSLLTIMSCPPCALSSAIFGLIPRWLLPCRVIRSVLRQEGSCASNDLRLSGLRPWTRARSRLVAQVRSNRWLGLTRRTQLLHHRSRIPVVSLLENLPAFEPHDGDAPDTGLFALRRLVEKRRAVPRGPGPLDCSAIGVPRVADQDKRIPPMCRIHEATEELPQRGLAANRLAQRDVLEPCILSVQLHEAAGFGAAEPAKPASCPCVVHGLPPGSRGVRTCLVRPNGHAQRPRRATRAMVRWSVKFGARTRSADHPSTHALDMTAAERPWCACRWLAAACG